MTSHGVPSSAEVEQPSVMLRFEGVTVRFGDRVAVDDVSMELLEGRTLGIVGESGSGKSTCVRLALGLERASEGRVLFREQPYSSKARHLRDIRSRIGFVFQDPYDSLDPRMKIGDIIAEPLLIKGIKGDEAQRLAAETLSAVGLPDAPLDSYPSRYSGGGRQRIAIARGLVLNPEVLICDEPTASLDVSVLDQIVNLLLRLKSDRGISIVFVSHDLDLVRRVTDDLVVMYAGRVMELGPSDEISERPRHPYTAALLSAVPGDHPARRKLATRARTVKEEGNTTAKACVFAPRCPRVQAVCRTQVPGLGSIDGSQSAACFFPLDN